MKGLIGFGVVALIALFVVFYYMGKGMDDDGDKPFGMAVGKPEGVDAPMHVVISMGMTRSGDPPKMSGGVQQWDQWVNEHYELREDSSGTKLPFTRSNFSNIINEREAMNPEFYIVTRVKPNTAYTFDYIPILADKTRYRYKFTVGADGLAFSRPSFKVVK